MLSEMTYHAFEQRKNRFAYITDTVGFGNPVASMPSKTDNTSIRTLTDTGVIIVTNKYTNPIVNPTKKVEVVTKTEDGTVTTSALAPNAIVEPGTRLRYTITLTT